MAHQHPIANPFSTGWFFVRRGALVLSLTSLYENVRLNKFSKFSASS